MYENITMKLLSTINLNANENKIIKKSGENSLELQKY
jgi:hypothetical protein